MTSIREDKIDKNINLLEISSEYPLESTVYLRAQGSTVIEDETVGTVIGYELCENEIMLRVLYNGAIKTLPEVNLVLQKESRNYHGTVIATASRILEVGDKISIVMQLCGEIKNLKDETTRDLYKVKGLLRKRDETVMNEESLEKYNFSFVCDSKIYKVRGKEAEFCFNLDSSGE